MAPLRFSGRPLGVIVGDRAEGPFELTSDHLDLVRGIAHHAAVALELARPGAEVAALSSHGEGTDRVAVATGRSRWEQRSPTRRPAA